MLTDIQISMNSNKIKYSILSELFSDEVLNEIPNNEVTFILDSNKVFEFFFSSNFKNTADNIINSSKEDRNIYSFGIASEFFNFIAHYRAFFYKLNIKTNFLLIHSNYDSIKDNLYPEWNSYYTEKSKINLFINFIVEKRIRYLASIIPDIYIVNGVNNNKNIDRNVIPFVLMKDENSPECLTNKTPFIFLISGDEANQYLYLHDNCLILKPSNKHPDCIFKGEYFEYITRKYKTPISIPDTYISDYLSLLGTKSISGVHEKIKPKEVITTISEPDFDITTCKQFVDKYGIEILEKLNLNRNLIDIHICYNNLTVSDKKYLSQQLYNDSRKKEAFSYNNSHFNNQINLTALFQN